MENVNNKNNKPTISTCPCVNCILIPKCISKILTSEYIGNKNLLIINVDLILSCTILNKYILTNSDSKSEPNPSYIVFRNISDISIPIKHTNFYMKRMNILNYLIGEDYIKYSKLIHKQ